MVMMMQAVLKVEILRAMKREGAPMSIRKVREALPWLNANLGSIWRALDDLWKSRFIYRLEEPSRAAATGGWGAGKSLVFYEITAKGQDAVVILEHVGLHFGLEPAVLFTSSDLENLFSILLNRMVFIKNRRAWLASMVWH